MSTLISSQIIEDVRLIQTVTYSSCALLVWDYLLTLDDEITYIWGSPTSVVKYLFIGNRYVNLLLQLFSISLAAGALPIDSATACLASSWGFALSKAWSYSSLHLLVLLRVWILYGRTLRVTIALAVVFILYLCASVTLLAYIVGGIRFSPTTYGATCSETLPPFSWLIWIVECMLEACLFGLTIFMLKHQFTSEFSRASRLVRSLYKHALIFLLANILDAVTNIVAWTVFFNTPLYFVTNSLTIALVNITGQRLAIDLRRLQIQWDVSRSEVSRVVEIQLAALNSDDSGVLVSLSTTGLP